ncbi:MAG TPA: methyltransferase domain-containing protein [Pirellulales bacterium]|jgi:2-polyprenyl-3-methyl-5-hydroxy-6-metoxy-1,4-benzoquinol methylase|nr:methyltransferase domain-containing protein [Pirellulales bacterium]
MPSAPTESIGDERLFAALNRRFDVVSTIVEIGGKRFEILRPFSADDLISEAEFNRDERLPYWAEFWPSSIALAQRLVSESGQGRSLLEFGCGTGLVATVAASVGFDVTATDYYADALEFAQLNALRNRAAISATRHVDWRDFPEDLGRFDVVVASDVLYERPNAAFVAAAFAATLKPNGLGILADPQRQNAAAFPVECRRRGLEIAGTAAIQIEHSAKRQFIDLYELRKA